MLWLCFDAPKKLIYCDLKHDGTVEGVQFLSDAMWWQVPNFHDFDDFHS